MACPLFYWCYSTKLYPKVPKHSNTWLHSSALKAEKPHKEIWTLRVPSQMSGWQQHNFSVGWRISISLSRFNDSNWMWAGRKENLGFQWTLCSWFRSHKLLLRATLNKELLCLRERPPPDPEMWFPNMQMEGFRSPQLAQLNTTAITPSHRQRSDLF